MEARKANLLEVLLTQVNIGLIEQPLPAREVEIWRGRQAKNAMHHHAEAFRGVRGGQRRVGLGEHRLLHDVQREWSNL